MKIAGKKYGLIPNRFQKTGFVMMRKTASLYFRTPEKPCLESESV
jgi:hypothetical protein